MLLSLAALALLDAGFAGFRAAAGRNPSIAKWRSGYYPRGVLRGLAIGALLALVPTGAVLMQLAFGASFDEVMARLDRELRPTAIVCGLYAGVVLVSFVPWCLPNIEVRTLMGVLIFGPVTLVRPLVILGALLVGLWSGPTPGGATVLAVGCAAALLVEPVLNAGYRSGFFEASRLAYAVPSDTQRVP